MVKLKVKKEETPPEDDNPIIKNRGKGKFKALIPAEEYDPLLVAQFAKKTKFVKRGGKEYVKVKGQFDPKRMPKVDDTELYKPPTIL